MKNYLYPFFWLHGEEPEVLTEYIEKISESGMQGLCIESRPHPDFVGEGWWKDVDHILAELKKRNMKMWILDDAHFPTGFANGKVKESYPEYLKIYLNMRRYDIQGTGRKIRIDFSLLKGRPWDRPDPSEKILGVYMAKRVFKKGDDRDLIDAGTLTDISENIDGRLLTLEAFPIGAYSIFVVYETPKGDEEATADYLNPLVKEATEVLINEVYEPHYAHYKDEFGKTIEGFFSDEPRFGNMKGTEWSIGKDMPLPWRPELEKELTFDKKMLPLLWVPASGVESEIRYKYMDLVTRLYQENFTEVLGNWCRAHGVWYMGHNIEDNGAHARLGYGAGHYFRGQTGMDFAGIDTIGGQIVPGMNYHHDAFNTGGSNGEFYHYALAKLASSAAHLDPAKKGRALCEAFGAYGWNEGLRMMSWIADHLLVRGINYLVPHAFNPKKYPDFDCPPHFYAHGHNPQFRYFKVFSDYVNRIADIFRNGKMPARVGVLYPAEQEWGGRYTPVEKLARELTEHQISFEIVTLDYLKSAKICNGCFTINEMDFDSLVIGGSEFIPEDLNQVMSDLEKAGVNLIVTGSIPGKEGISLYNLGSVMESQGYSSIELGKSLPELVFYEYEKAGKIYRMFFNENVVDAVDTTVRLKKRCGTVYGFDAWKDKYYSVSENDGSFRLCLKPYEAVVWCESGEIPENMENGCTVGDSCALEFELPESGWKVSFSDSMSYPEFTVNVGTDRLTCVSDLTGFEDKTGTVRFSNEIEIEKTDSEKYVLDLGLVSEIAEVFVNGKSAGVRICEPYTFDLSGLLAYGKNQIEIDVTNSLGTEQRDVISHYLPIETFGIIGHPTIFCQK